jgi:hypothetical protein
VALAEYARPDGRAPLKTARDRAGNAASELAWELGRIREEVGCLKGQLKEIRASNLRLQKEVKEGFEERRRLMEEVLELGRPRSA